MPKMVVKYHDTLALQRSGWFVSSPPRVEQCNAIADALSLVQRPVTVGG